MMTKRITLAAAVALFGLFLVGCGSETKPAQTTPEQDQSMKGGMKKYEKK